MVRRFALALAIVLTLLAPSMAKAQTAAEAIAADLDAWWAEQFAARGLVYTSPQLELVSEPGTEFCASIDVFYAPAGYCSTNQEITISTGFVSPDAVGALLPLISHEWGHHIQNLTDTGAYTPLEQELQADCFAGAFIDFAADSDWISPVVAAMALQLTQSAGDVWWEGSFDEAIHGTKADRASRSWPGRAAAWRRAVSSYPLNRILTKRRAPRVSTRGARTSELGVGRYARPWTARKIKSRIIAPMTAAMKLPMLQPRVNVPPPINEKIRPPMKAPMMPTMILPSQPCRAFVAGNHARYPTSERSENDPGDDPEATVDVHHCPPDSPAGRPGVALV